MKPSWPESELLEDIKHIVRRRKALPMLAATNPTNILSLGNSAVFAFARQGDGGTMVCLFNFSEMWQRLPAQKLRDAGVTGFFDTLGEGKPELQEDHLSLPPYGRLWLT